MQNLLLKLAQAKNKPTAEDKAEKNKFSSWRWKLNCLLPAEPRESRFNWPRVHHQLRQMQEDPTQNILDDKRKASVVRPVCFNCQNQKIRCYQFNQPRPTEFRLCRNVWSMKVKCLGCFRQLPHGSLTLQTNQYQRHWVNGIIDKPDESKNIAIYTTIIYILDGWKWISFYTALFGIIHSKNH